MTTIDLWKDVEQQLAERGYTLATELTDGSANNATSRVWRASYQNGSPQPETVALKVSIPGTVTSLTISGDLEELAEREARIYEQLGSHPHIPQFKGFTRITVGGMIPLDVLATEYIDASTLLKRIQDKQRLSEEEAMTVLKDTLSALVHVHSELEKQVLHRDIKPSNILFDGVKAYLFDFNFSKIGEASRASQFIENVYYPLDSLGGRQTQSQDLVALGNVVISTGYGLEVEGVRAMQGKDVLTTVDVDALPYSVKLKSFLRKLTATQPALRFQTARQALDVLENLATIDDHALEEDLSSIVRSKGMDTLLERLKEEDLLFEYHVPIGVRADLDDDTLLDHLRRIYAQDTFVIDDPVEIKRYLSPFGDRVIKKGTKFINKRELKADDKGYLKKDLGGSILRFLSGKQTWDVARTDIDVFMFDNLLGRNAYIRASDLKKGRIPWWSEVRYRGQTKVLYDGVIPDGAEGVVSWYQKDDLDIVWFSRSDLTQWRKEKSGAPREYRLTTDEIKLLRKNPINFDRLYNDCFEAGKP